MKTRMLLTTIFVYFLIALNIQAQEPVAKIQSFTGEVLIHKGKAIVKVTNKGHVLNNGDYIQTKEGTVQLSFSDGSIIKINPFTNIMVREKEEKEGFWMFKEKIDARRITCFIGKIWFKSGASKKRNFLQTPTAVCGVRGSDGDFGFDNVNTFVNMYTGSTRDTGNVRKGGFDNPGRATARDSRVYQSLAAANQNYEKAKAGGKGIDIARSVVDIIKVTKVSTTEMKRNPDESVKSEAHLKGISADAEIAAAVTHVVVEKFKLAEAAAEKVVENARLSGNSEAVALAMEQAANVVSASAEAESMAKTANMAAEDADEAAESGDLGKAEAAANIAANMNAKANDLEEDFQEIVDEAVESVSTDSSDTSSDRSSDPNENPPTAPVKPEPVDPIQEPDVYTQ